MTQAVIAGYVRSAFTRAGSGELADTRPDDLAGRVIAELVRRSGIDPLDIEDVVLGCAFPEGEQGFNIGRIAGVIAGLPVSVAGSTINRLCGSSMQAIHTAAGSIAFGAGEVYVCAGVESMSRVSRVGSEAARNPALDDVYVSMGQTAENVAAKFRVTRERQEQFALGSHQKAVAAQEDGRLTDEIVTVDGVDQDGCIRPDTTLEALAALHPAFAEGGTVTAGTSSPLTDGATATLVTSADYAQRRGLRPLAAIRSIAVSGVDPAIMGMGPVEATRKALQRGGIGVGDLDIIELNEAFASQALACIDELGLDPEKVNVDGGAIALGHPLGATGARITGKAAQILQRDGGRFALATQCIGGGQGIATVLEGI